MNRRGISELFVIDIFNLDALKFSVKRKADLAIHFTIAPYRGRLQSSKNWTKPFGERSSSGAMLGAVLPRQGPTDAGDGPTRPQKNKDQQPLLRAIDPC
jgi:hypothetical protein